MVCISCDYCQWPRSYNDNGGACKCKAMNRKTIDVYVSGGQVPEWCPLNKEREGKAVLISINPKWCDLIADGKKTIEVRKTRPKLETPFKVYIYETQGRTETPWVDEDGHEIYKGRGQVIGEFVCDEIFPIKVNYNGTIKDYNWHNMFWSCVPYEDISNYIGRGKVGCGLSITDLVIYDKPRELSEFKTFCKSYYDGDKCDDCKYFINARGYEYDESDCGCNGLKPIERPPQSWCYVERSNENAE